MKRGRKCRAVCAGLALCFMLSACGAGASDPADSQIAARALQLPLDLKALESAMPAEDWAALEAYLPVLDSTGTFSWAGRPDKEEEPDYSHLQNVTLTEFHGALWDGYDEVPDTLSVNCLTVQDVDGDGGAELCLLVEEFGWYYLIFHQEGDTVYVTDVSIRAFEGLQTNGVYFGSGGAGDTTYYQMRFEDGEFFEQELAHREEWAFGISCTLDGQDATEAEFDAWTAENLPGEVTWYAPDGTASTGIAA